MKVFYTDFGPVDAVESPIEAEFYGLLSKTASGNNGIRKQVTFGKYRVDFLFESFGKKIAIELDGKQFHNYQRDMNRDRDLLNGYVDEIIRIPGAAIYAFPNLTMIGLSKWHPRFSITEETTTMSLEDFYKERDKVIRDYDSGQSDHVETYENDVKDIYQIYEVKEDHYHVGYLRSFLEYQSYQTVRRIRRILERAMGVVGS
jgi:hypothetical protein